MGLTFILGPFLGLFENWVLDGFSATDTIKVHQISQKLDQMWSWVFKLIWLLQKSFISIAFFAMSKRIFQKSKVRAREKILASNWGSFTPSLRVGSQHVSRKYQMIFIYLYSAVMANFSLFK